jgi:hypothetical protein
VVTTNPRSRVASLSVASPPSRRSTPRADRCQHQPPAGQAERAARPFLRRGDDRAARRSAAARLGDATVSGRPCSREQPHASAARSASSTPSATSSRRLGWDEVFTRPRVVEWVAVRTLDRAAPSRHTAHAQSSTIEHRSPSLRVQYRRYTTTLLSRSFARKVAKAGSRRSVLL